MGTALDSLPLRRWVVLLWVHRRSPLTCRVDQIRERSWPQQWHCTRATKRQYRHRPLATWTTARRAQLLPAVGGGAQATADRRGGRRRASVGALLPGCHRSSWRTPFRPLEVSLSFAIARWASFEYTECAQAWTWSRRVARYDAWQIIATGTRAGQDGPDGGTDRGRDVGHNDPREGRRHGVWR